MDRRRGSASEALHLDRCELVRKVLKIGSRILYTIHMASSFIVITGHGVFASSLLATAEMIVGPADHARAVDFPVGNSVEVLTAHVKQVIDDLLADDPEREILILSDVAGGSPSRVALTEAAAGRAHAITGTNLPLLIDALIASRTAAVSDLVSRFVSVGQDGIKDLTALVGNQGGIS